MRHTSKRRTTKFFRVSINDFYFSIFLQVIALPDSILVIEHLLLDVNLVVDCDVYLLHLMISKGLGKEHCPAWPYSHDGQLVLAAHWELSWDSWPSASVCFLLLFSTWLLWLPYSLVVRFPDYKGRHNNVQELVRLFMSYFLCSTSQSQIDTWPRPEST